jgi:subtilisin family serine protease
MEDFVVLRDLASARFNTPFGTGVRGLETGPSAFDLPQPSIEVETVDSRGRAELLSDPSVLAGCPAMPTTLIDPVETRDAEATDAAWGVTAVGADQSTFDGSDTVVAVLDTGIDATHPAFGGVQLEQQDFTGSGNGDHQSHGTHCAGTILGRDSDGQRIGVARGVSRALIGKVLGDDGGGGSEMLFRGMQWAVDNGAQVISMSLGFDFPGLVKRLVDAGWPADLATSRALEAYRGNLRVFDAIMATIAARGAIASGGTVVVAAAGNESKRDQNPDYEIAVSLPAAANDVVSVGALGEGQSGYVIARFSNTFPRLSGPGVNITSAKLGGGLSVKSGTSMACPHVAGVAALWWQAVRDRGVPATAQNVIAQLVATSKTDSIDPNVDVADRGTGMVSAP